MGFDYQNILDLVGPREDVAQFREQAEDAFNRRGISPDTLRRARFPVPVSCFDSPSDRGIRYRFNSHKALNLKDAVRHWSLNFPSVNFTLYYFRGGEDVHGVFRCRSGRTELDREGEYFGPLDLWD